MISKAYILTGIIAIMHEEMKVVLAYFFKTFGTYDLMKRILELQV